MASDTKAVGPVANLNWNADNGKWNLNDWNRDDNRWNPGNRAFPKLYKRPRTPLTSGVRFSREALAAIRRPSCRFLLSFPRAAYNALFQ